LTCRYGECKVGVVYEATQDKNGKDRQVLARAYVATLENAEAFGPLLGTLAHQQGQHRCRDLVVLADGAVWIWQIAAKQFTGATQIVDFFHACQHLRAMADARFGAESEEGHAWQQARRADLLADRVESVLLEMKAWQPRSEAKRKLRQTEYNYFYTNAARMRYKTFAQKGYHIGSGVVEASCKQIATQRMKLAGMHWRQETAEAILTLRAAQLSTQPPDLKAFCGMAN
jgi:DNA polymerase IIIc chi subunit